MVGERLRGGGGARAARTKMKAGLGFEATIAPNTTSGLADEGTQGRHQDWARGRGDIFTEGFEALLEVLIGVSIYFGFSEEAVGCCSWRLHFSIQSPFDDTFPVPTHTALARSIASGGR